MTLKVTCVTTSLAVFSLAVHSLALYNRISDIRLIAIENGITCKVKSDH